VAAPSTTFSATLEAVAEKSGARGIPQRARETEEQTPVEGHHYAKITAGMREGQLLNTSGNERHGRAFELVERGGRTFHVYGTGKDRIVVEIKPAASESPGVAGAPAAPTTAA
jgi:hypothetical protein